MRSFSCLLYVMKHYFLGMLQELDDSPTKNEETLSFHIPSSPSEMASTTESPPLYLVQWQLHATNGHTEQNRGEDLIFRKTPPALYFYCHSSRRQCHWFRFFPSIKKGILCRACFFTIVFSRDVENYHEVGAVKKLLMQTSHTVT